MTVSKEGKALQDGPNGISRNPAAGKNGRPVLHQFEVDDRQCIAFLAKSLSGANRLRILLLVSSGRKSVSAIVEALDLSQPLVSHHLKELRRALLVRVECEGPFIYHELADPGILDVL